MPIAFNPSEKVKIVIDRGGTFTDVIGMSESRGDCLIKLLSVDPNNYADAPTEGVRRVLEWFTRKTLPRSVPIDTSAIEYLRMGTTVATNALLERKGERCALLITKGHGDCLEIGTQRRPALFDLAIKKPEVLYSRVVEIDERIVPDMPELGEDIAGGVDDTGFLVDGVSGKKMRVLRPIDVAQVTADLRSLHQDGYRSVAIVFAHSYIYNGHEKQVEKLARNVGFDHISVSSDLQAMINLYSRGSSATADAYLTPEISRYVDGFISGFEEKLQSDDCKVSFMQSDGALTDFRSFSGLKAILSGPAGGVVGFARTSYDPRNGSPVVGFDMGGTSTDVSRYAGSLEHVFETTTAGVSIQTPQLDINTVAAGGGSILFYRNGLFHVGPESAGAHPGPACYRKGGPLTVTDANLLLGRLHIDSFPKIFGPTEDMPLDLEIVKEKFKSLTTRINLENDSCLTDAEVANGFINVANSAMARPIRALTEQRGFRTSDHNLSCFGGAGGQHAAALAALLGMSLVIVHKFSSVLSAYGMALADIAVDVSEASVLVYSSEVLPDLLERFAVLQAQALDKLLAQGVPEDSVSYERYLSLRFTGSDTNIVVPEPKDGDWATAFVQRHLREFAFVLDATVEVDGIRVRGVSKGDTSFDEAASTWVDELNSLPRLADATPFATCPVYFEDLGNYIDTPLYRLDALAAGIAISGPAIVLDTTQTLLIHPHNTARILKDHVIIDVGLGAKKQLDTKVADPIQLSIFGHRFMGIAEQMGRTLQKTSVSLQIKERLDFSCAIFGPDASLVANAPNVPVHLGSMQYAVAYQAEKHKGNLRPGDIIVSNMPEAGGSHLPDITVMQPVFETGTDEIVFWVAARGHHTDIGGLHGSCMHPDIIERDQEGAVFESTFLVRDGIFNESEVIEIFKKAGDYPDCLPSRRLDHNLSDLKAQCAACAVGTAQIHTLFEEYGKEVVHFYMRAIRDNSELAVRNFLKTKSGQILQAEERMDDGTPLRLEVTINQEDGSAKFDFTGTGEETLGNYNAPESVCRSALTYALRVLIGTDMPLNAGVLAPIEIVIPKGSILSCSDEAPVYLGNGETSQRAVDLIFKAFEACANGHGSMNTTLLVYKKDSWGDSTCGGAAAGPGFDGASAVHVNMTNTRIGDTEILESRFPAILREFSIRRGSGGAGAHTGGCGITRIYEARAPMDVYHAGERRVVEPAGLHGGGPGERGSSFWNKKMKNGSFRTVRTKPAAYVRLKAGEAFIVNTAGGGGYGTLTNGCAPRAFKATAVGQTEESSYNHSHPRATTASMPEPNYAIHLEVAEYINQKKANTPREAAMLIARLVNHRNPHIAMLTLALLDTLVQSCGYPFHLQIATKEFLNELVRRFPERPPPFPGPVMSRILELIHTWKEGICTDSRWKDDLGNIRDMHRLLTFKGYRFRDMPRGNRNETAVATSNLKSAEELEEEDRQAQSAKLQELIRRGTPRDLAAAQELMKTLAGANPEAKPDYRTQALTELNKLEQKVILLNEILDNVDPERGEAFAKGDVYDQVASILISSRPKIQKWISDAESEDPESLDTYLQINDQINSVLNRYESYQKGDFTAAANPIPAELAGSSVRNDLSLIDFDDAPPPPPASSQSNSNNGNGTPADDLAGLFSVSGSAPVQGHGPGYGHGQGAGSNGNGITSIISQFNAAPAQQSYFQQPHQQQQVQHPGTRAGMGMGMGSHPSFGGVGMGGAMGSVQPQYSGGMGGMGGMGVGAASGSGSGTTSPQSHSRPSSQFGQIMLPSTPKPMSPVGTGTGGVQGAPQHPQQQQVQQAQGKDPFADLAGLF